MTSISTIGLYISYVIPVGLHLKARARPERGPWHLGRYSRVTNAAALVWVLFMCVILCLADSRTLKSVVGVTLLLAVWYSLRERSRFQGPAWVIEEGVAK